MRSKHTRRNFDFGRAICLVLVAAMALGACSMKRMAVNVAAGSLAGSGDAYAAEEDPQLVYEAIPFGLKTFESMLAISPRNRDLLMASATGFTGYAFLAREKAELSGDISRAAIRGERARASRLFLRGRDFALRALELQHPGITDRLRKQGAAALAETGPADADALYWAGAAWAAAISARKGRMDLVVELPFASALVRRVLQIDESYGDGAAHEFMISFEGGRPGGSAAAARRHYRKALQFSRGGRASIHLALAENVSVARQDIGEFEKLLRTARKIDVVSFPRFRLSNEIALRRARWLSGRMPNLFVNFENKETRK